MMKNQFASASALLWICGVGLRLGVLAVPPVISLIQADLQMSGTEIGILSGLPVVLFAVAAAPGSRLVGWAGVRLTLATGLVVTALGSGLRALAPEVYSLYAATILMSAGIAIMQPAMASAVRQWMPDRAAFGTALYTSGLIVGEIVPVVLMLPVLLPLFDQSWRLGLLSWSAPLLVIAAVVLIFCPRGNGGASTAARGTWWPDLRSGLNWQIGLILAGASSVYFSTNAFLPAFLESVGHGSKVSVALTTVNVSQLPAVLLLVFLADWIQGKRWPLLAFCGLTVLGVLGVMVSTAWWMIALSAGVIGMASAAQLAIGLSLPPLLARNPDDVAHVIAAAFAISYSYTMGVSFVSGVAWDLAGAPVFAFIPIFIAGLPSVFVALKISFEQRTV
ncbi:major facilitator superfamily MFS_1 [Afipia carboxidovorans OM5]|nr:MFS transporter [Afipia carboxidovorans]ACI91862.1 major facilitator superfamily MFS_1 [Afipia carboxidovorans OM5]